MNIVYDRYVYERNERQERHEQHELLSIYGRLLDHYRHELFAEIEKSCAHTILVHADLHSRSNKKNRFTNCAIRDPAICIQADQDRGSARCLWYGSGVKRQSHTDGLCCLCGFALEKLQGGKFFYTIGAVWIGIGVGVLISQ